jgi:hypothetical protein
MSNHLIQTIPIDGTRYCPYELVLTSLQISGTNQADISDELEYPELISMPANDISADGEYSFGVSCEDSWSYFFEAFDGSTTPDYSATIQIYVNGVAYGSAITLSSAGSYSDLGSISLTDSPCGNVITYAVSVERGGESDSEDGPFYIRVSN